MALMAAADDTGLLTKRVEALGKLPPLLFLALYGEWLSKSFGISFTMRAFLSSAPLLSMGVQN
jgi:hypothetical protein